MNNKIVTVDNYKVGDKVVLNKQVANKKDIDYFERLECVYGIIKRTRFGISNIVEVSLINHKGLVIDTVIMFIGHVNMFELFFYE